MIKTPYDQDMEDHSMEDCLLSSLKDQPGQQPAVLQVQHSGRAAQSPPKSPLQATHDHPHRPLYPEEATLYSLSTRLNTNLCQGNVPLFI